ncbi:MAG: carboxymuconolactone decarboxylase family protein [Rhodospirillaceae bacterium]
MTTHIEALKNTIPAYAKDLRLNFSAVAADTTLTPQQTFGGLLAAAIASRNEQVIGAIAADASAVLTPQAFDAAKTAAAIMAMNNIYYRFVHLVSDQEYGTLPARLRMNALANPGVDKVDFELWSLIVSAVNGCGLCIDSHEKILRKAGLTAAQIQQAVRIAAVVHAVAVTLEIEAAAAQPALAA